MHFIRWSSKERKRAVINSEISIALGGSPLNPHQRFDQDTRRGEGGGGVHGALDPQLFGMYQGIGSLVIHFLILVPDSSVTIVGMSGF